MDVSENFAIEMEVLAAPTAHDGNLFAIGSKQEFPYYEWRTKANGTQYLVVEIVYSSVVLTLKALGTYNLHSMEIFRTYPTPYDVGDGKWHKIKGMASKLTSGVMGVGCLCSVAVTRLLASAVRRAAEERNAGDA
jgi:hypothetical protein